MTAWGLLAEHLDWCLLKEPSPGSIIKRRGAVSRFFRWQLERDADPLDLDPADVLAWQVWMVKQGFAVTYRRSEASHVRLFYAWLTSEDVLVKDPTRRIVLPTVKPGLPDPTSETEFDKALRLAAEEGALDVTAALWLAGGAAARAIETARLGWQHIADTGDMRLHGKGNKWRKVNILECTGLVVALNALPNAWTRGPVIPRHDGKPGHNTENAFDKWINTWLHEHGFEWTYHKLRKRALTQVQRSQGDAVVTANVGGHSSLSNVLIYADADQDKIAAGMAATGVIHIPSERTVRRLRVVQPDQLAS